MSHHNILAIGMLSILLPARSPAQQLYEVQVERGVETQMRDGVILRADTYRPKADGKFPVLLQRTPYNKLWTSDTGYAAAAHGYIVIVQDTRGRYTSDGEFYPFRYEAQDGYDTVEWAAALPYSNGKVGMFGASYIGVTQMEAAAAAPPHLAGIFPVVTASDYHDGWTYQGGAYEQWFNQTWGSGLVQDTFDRLMQHRTMTVRDAMKLPLLNYPQIKMGLPDSFSPAAVAPYYKDWLAHPSYDDYWKAFSIEERYSKIRVPAYHVGGVYDIFLNGTLRNYLGIKKNAATAEARANQRLEIMMASHNKGGPKVGELDFGPNATFNELTTMLAWYDYIFKGEKNRLEVQKPVKIFVMGKNAYRYEEAWPPPGSHTERLYLHSGGSANSLSGNGSLSDTPGTSEPHDSFTYDPKNPVPTRGGPLCCDETDLPGGPFDQRAAESRPDVLVYTTKPFEQEMDVIGPVSIDMYASSSTADTDFTGKLIDVWPNGFAQNIAEGIVRAKYRNSQSKPELMTPGQVYRFSINLVAASDAILPGHRLRLEVSSSNSPRFDRNLNTGDNSGLATQMLVATNSVYHDAERRSALLIAVAPLQPQHSAKLAN